MMKLRKNGLMLCASMVLVIAGVAAVFSPAIAAQDSAKASFRVAGIRVAAPADEDEMRPFNWSSGTTIALRLDFPAGGLIEIDEDASKLQAFVDDKGTNLLEGEERFGNSGFGSFPKISEAGNAALIEITGPSVPAADAGKLIAKGTLVVRAATKKKTFTHKDVALKANGKIEAGSFPLTIKSFGKSDWQEDKNEVALTGKGDVSTIAEIRFLGADGKPLESDRISTMSFGSGESTNVEWSYTLPLNAKVVTVEIDYWQDMKTLELPFGVASGVGVK